MQLPKVGADCVGALKITDRLGPVKNATGFSKVELRNVDYGQPYVMPREYNPGWFKYIAESSGLLNIRIISQQSSDDYNWALYVSTGPWFCSTFMNEEWHNPIRANLSPADAATGVTGMNDQGTEPLCDAAAGNPFCNTLAVNPGDEFYLYIDSAAEPQNGYTIEITIIEGN